MSAQAAEQAAGWLAEAWENGQPLAPLPPELAPAGREAGEAIAALLIERLGVPVTGLRLVARPGRASLAAPILGPRLLRAGIPVSLATLPHAALSAGVLGILAEPLEDGAPVFSSLHPVLDLGASRFTTPPEDDALAVADLAGLGMVLVGKRSAGPLPEQAEVRLGVTGARPRPIQEQLGALMAEAAAEARRWGGLPAGAALAVVGLGGIVVPRAGEKYAAAVAGVGRISSVLS